MNPNAAQAQQGGGNFQAGQQPFPYPGNQAGNGTQVGQSGQIGQDGPNKPGQPQGVVSPMQQAGSLQSVLQGIGNFLARINHPLSGAFNNLHGFGPQGSAAMNGIQTATQPTGSQQSYGQNLGKGAGGMIQNAIGGGQY